MPITAKTRAIRQSARALRRDRLPLAALGLLAGFAAAPTARAVEMATDADSGVAARTSTRPAPAAPLPLALPARRGDEPLENPAPAAVNAPANSKTTTPPTASSTARVIGPTASNPDPTLVTPRRVQLGCSLRDYGAPVERGQVAAAVFNTCSGFSLHQPMFFGISQSPEYNGNQSEVVFQLSGKGQIYDFGPTKLYAAYTQESYFEPFNSAHSRIFRETDYKPELFFRTPTPLPKMLPDVSFDAGFEHQSNGQDIPGSRSFNRLFVEPYYTAGRQAISLRLWYRLPENDSKPVTDPGRDDNPDINRYLGYGEFHYRRDFDWKNSLIDVGVRFNPASGKGALQTDYSFTPMQGAAVFLRGFTGYGDSLIDYNHYVTRVIVGVALQR